MHRVRRVHGGGGRRAVQETLAREHNSPIGNVVPTPENDQATVEGLLSRDGAAVHLLDVDPLTGRLALLPSSSWEVWGSTPHPATWRYDLSVPAPSSGTRQVWAGRDQVLHVQWTSHPRYPWRSVGPWAASASTSRLAARIEQTLAREHNSPIGNVVPTPENDQANRDRCRRQPRYRRPARRPDAVARRAGDGADVQRRARARAARGPATRLAHDPHRAGPVEGDHRSSAAGCSTT